MLITYLDYFFSALSNALFRFILGHIVKKLETHLWLNLKTQNVVRNTILFETKWCWNIENSNRNDQDTEVLILTEI